MENLKELSLHEKEKLFKKMYPEKCNFLSKNHELIKNIKEINKNLDSNPEHLMVIEGLSMIELAIQNNIDIKDFIVCLDDIYSIEAQQVIKDISETKDINIVSKKSFNTIAEKGNSSGLIAVIKLNDYSLEDIASDNSVILVLDGLEIPGNVGTILRSSDATNIDAVIFTNRRVRLSDPKLIRGSRGACFMFPIIECELDELKKYLAEKKYDVFLADTRGASEYYDLSYTGNVALVMGSERYGISKEWYEDKFTPLSIPMLGKCDSLNVGVATSILLYEIALKKSGKINR